MIIDRYVFREVTIAFFFCFSVFIFAGLIAVFLQKLQRGMEAGLELTTILFQILINAVPGVLVTVLPLSITIGILMGLGRMAADNEIAAMKSSGISVVRLLPGVIALGLIGLSISLACTLVLIPRGISKGRELKERALTSKAAAAIEERTFFDGLKNLTIYAEGVDSAAGQMTNVFIREASDPDEVKTFLAKRGQQVPDPKGKDLVIVLEDGTMIKSNSNGDTTGTLVFDRTVLRYPIRPAGESTSARTFEEKSVGEVWKSVREAQELERTSTGRAREFYDRMQRFGRIFITQRFVHPAACLALALCTFPLGVTGMGKSRLNNVALGLVVIFIYYTFSLTVERTARSGLMPPEVVLILPPVVFTAVGLYFLRCVRLEHIPAAVRLARQAIRAVRNEA